MKDVWKWVMVGVVVAIFVTAAVLLIVGLTTHDEPGFVSDNRWDHMPLTVGCAVYGEHRYDARCESVQDVVNLVNHRVIPAGGGGALEHGVFQFNGIDPDADVLVVIGVPSDDSSHWEEANGFAELSGRDGVYRLCMAMTSNTGTDEMRARVLHHELACHCLGLAHDDFESSICNAVQSPTPDRQFPPRLTDHDVALLRERYGRL